MRKYVVLHSDIWEKLADLGWICEDTFYDQRGRLIAVMVYAD